MDLLYNLPIGFLKEIAFKRIDKVGDKFHYIINSQSKNIREQLVIDLRWFMPDGQYYYHPLVVKIVRKLNRFHYLD